MESSQLLTQLMVALKDIGSLPKYCDLSKIGPLHMASVYSHLDPGYLISESVQCGMDLNKDTAVIKALVECIERQAIEHGQQAELDSCLTLRSDGFAAFPKIGSIGAQTGAKRARQNALAEATERFVWSTWWDNIDIGAKVVEIKESSLGDPKLCFLVSEISKILPVSKILMIEPFVSSSTSVSIFFFILESGGIVTGGAASESTDLSGRAFRALGELSRHMVCAKKILEGARPSTFYENRLCFMATEKTSDLLFERIGRSSNQEIVLPFLKFDEQIPHPLNELVAVHRCLFNLQPQFIGGKLERLCL